MLPLLAALSLQAPAPDLYTVELIGTPELRRFGGVAELLPAESPFTVSVTPEGIHRYRVVVRVDSLPDPRTLGSYSTYMVWAAPPTLAPMQRLGELPGPAGAVPVGEVALNRFLLFVTAEPHGRVTQPTGPLVLRGLSPSMRLGMPHLVQAASAPPDHAGHGRPGWEPPPPHPVASPMYMPGLAGLAPATAPWLPPVEPEAPLVRPRTLRRLATGDSIRLEAGPVRRQIGGRLIRQYGFNGEQPGPLVEVSRGAVVSVNFVNRTPLPTAIHWHGVRLENRFDGVPHLTQPPVAPGDSFRYEIRFPDAGVYWYHPHHREDIQQDLGLYGNILVRGDGFGDAVHREEILMLDDLLLQADGSPAPYGRDRATHALMGRFGNLFLVNGEPAAGYRLRVSRGEVVRFLLTNAANTRTFNLSFGGARIKLVGGDIGPRNREEWVGSVVLAPAERWVVEVAFEESGVFPLLNRIQAIDHTLGRFFPEQDTLGVIQVGPDRAVPIPTRDSIRFNQAVDREIAGFRARAEAAPLRSLRLSLRDRGLPAALVQLLRPDTVYVNPVEWSGTMPMMDWLPTAGEVEWLLRDEASGRENEEIGWSFRAGELVRIRLVNDRHTLHSMAHPVHLHGQRFLVLAVNGSPAGSFGWKDTVLVPAGSVVDILVEMTNPGRWMMHCHIAEHLEAGMSTVVTVLP